MTSSRNGAGSFRFIFRFHHKQHFVTIGKASRVEAEAKAAQVEYLLLGLKQGLIELPPGIPIVPFLQGDEKLDVAKSGALATPAPITLGSLGTASWKPTGTARSSSGP